MTGGEPETCERLCGGHCGKILNRLLLLLPHLLVARVREGGAPADEGERVVRGGDVGRPERIRGERERRRRFSRDPVIFLKLVTNLNLSVNVSQVNVAILKGGLSGSSS